MKRVASNVNTTKISNSALSIRGEDMEALGDIFKSEAVNGWQLLGLIAALGAVTMAILQLVTDLFPLRSIFQAIWLRRWIGQRVTQHLKSAAAVDAQSGEEATDAELKEEVPRLRDDAFTQLILQATAGHSQAFFGLSTSQLVAQINAAAQAALENPEQNSLLLAVLTQSTDPWAPLLIRSKKERNDERTSQYMGDLDEVGRYSGSYPPAESPELKSYLDARTRLLHRIQRNLDSMQISLTNDAAWVNQIFAILISLGIAYLIIRTKEASSPSFWWMVLLLGVAGGYAAPLLGDIVVAIRRLGRE